MVNGPLARFINFSEFIMFNSRFRNTMIIKLGLYKTKGKKKSLITIGKSDVLLWQHLFFSRQSN